MSEQTDDLDLDLDIGEGESQQQQIQTEQSAKPDEPAQQQTQPPSQEEQLQQPITTLDKFKKEDGTLDYDKIAESYVNLEKDHGRLRQETGELRKTLFSGSYPQLDQSQVAPQMPPQQQFYPEQRAGSQQQVSADDISSLLGPDVTLSEGDLRAIVGIASKAIEQDRQYYMTQQQQLQARQQQAYNMVIQKRSVDVDNFAKSVYREIGADAEKQAEIEKLFYQSADLVNKATNYLKTGQGLTPQELDKAIRDLNNRVEINQKQRTRDTIANELKSLGIIEASKRQAAQAVTNPNGTAGRDTGVDDFLKGIREEDREAFEHFLG